MHPNDRHLVWFVLVTSAGYLVRQCCHAADYAPAASSARKLSAGVAPMNFNHLFGQGDFDGVVALGTGESVKFGASKQHVPHPGSLQSGAWRKSAISSSSSSSGGPAGNWGARKPLAKPSSGSRGRINNRSMTRFSEVEIPVGLLHYREAGAGERTAPTTPGTTNVTGLAELFRSAEQSRGVENFFWKYLVDSDVSASTDEEAVDDEGDADDAALQPAGDRSDSEPRKKKFHLKKKYKKFLIPLLLAYKIKFLALVPAIIGGLILLVKAAGLAGFFFALFTAVVSLKKY